MGRKKVNKKLGNDTKKYLILQTTTCIIAACGEKKSPTPKIEIYPIITGTDEPTTPSWANS